MVKEKVYSIKFTLFLNFIVATSDEEAVQKAKDYFVENSKHIPMKDYKIEIESKEK